MRDPWMPISAVRYKVRQVWRRQIMPTVRTDNPLQLLAALVIASTCVDEILLAEGYPGESSGERIYQARASFSAYERLCMARRLRHLAVHHLDFRLNKPACTCALASFAQALRDHGVILDDIPAYIDLDQCTIDDADHAMLPFHSKHSRQDEASVESSNRNRSACIVSEDGAPVRLASGNR